MQKSTVWRRATSKICFHISRASGNGTPNVFSPSQAEMTSLFEELNSCNIKSVALSLTDEHADSMSIPVVSDLFETQNLDLDYHELLQNVQTLTWILDEKASSWLRRTQGLRQREQDSFVTVPEELAPRSVGLLFTVTFHNNLRHWWKVLVSQMFSRLTLRPQDMGSNMRMMLFVHMEIKWRTHSTFTLTQCGLFVKSNMHLYMPRQIFWQHVIAMDLVAEKWNALFA